MQVYSLTGAVNCPLYCIDNSFAMRSLWDLQATTGTSQRSNGPINSLVPVP
jgi:hypothetical protein